MKALVITALMPLIEQAAKRALISNKHAPFKGKSKLGFGLMALSGLFFGASLIFALLAGYGWLLTQFTQPIAALIAAGSVLSLSLLSALVGYYALKKKPRAIPESADKEVEKLMGLINEALSEELMQPIHDNPKTAIALAGLAGFVAGDRLN